MTQAEARRRAKELSEETGGIYIADAVRESPRGDGWIRGGWASQGDTWAVIHPDTSSLVEM